MVTRKTVRRNLTLDMSTAAELDMAASFLGKSQSQVIDMAFNQVPMKRMMGYILHQGYSNGFVQLMDDYQATERLDAETSTKIWNVFLNDILPVLTFHLPIFDVNEYVACHMPAFFVENSDVMKDWYDRAKVGTLVKSSTIHLSQMIEDYVHEILNQGKRFLTESYAFRNIVVLCDVCCNALSDEQSLKIFHAFENEGLFC